MIRICAWCKKELGSVEPLADTSQTHGICEACEKKLVAHHLKRKKNPITLVGLNPERPHGKFRHCVKKVKQSLKKYGRKGDPKKICGAALSKAYQHPWYVVIRRSDKAGLILKESEMKPEYKFKRYFWVHGPFTSHKQADQWFRSKASLNPPLDRCPKVAGIIYNKAIDIHATKTKYRKGDYEHPFGPKVRVEALDNGDVLLHHTDGKPLWTNA